MCPPQVPPSPKHVKPPQPLYSNPPTTGLSPRMHPIPPHTYPTHLPLPPRTHREKLKTRKNQNAKFCKAALS